MSTSLMEWNSVNSTFPQAFLVDKLPQFVKAYQQKNHGCYYFSSHKILRFCVKIMASARKTISFALQCKVYRPHTEHK